MKPREARGEEEWMDSGTRAVNVSAVEQEPGLGEGDFIFPLSYAQQRLWFLQQLEPESTAYNLAAGVRLRGRLQVAGIENALREIVGRHEALRTSFPMRNGEPVQRVHEVWSFRMEVRELSEVEEGRREEVVRARAEEEAGKAFDLARGPLLRAELLRLAEEDHVLLITLHHIVADGWSVAILTRELTRLYAAYLDGEKCILEDLPIQYGDYAVWQREWLQGQVLEEQLGYWRKQLTGLEPLALPTDHHRPAVMSHPGGRVAVCLSAELTKKLTKLGSQDGVTLFMTLLAGFHLVLGRYTGQEDVAIGTAIANRNRAETEGLIGFFANTLVLRTDSAGNPTVGELLRRVRKVALEAYQYQDVPFEKLVEELHPGRDTGRPPLVQVMMILQNTQQQDLHLKGLKVAPFELSVKTAKFDLLLAWWEGAEGRLRGELVYAQDLFEASTIERLVSYLKVILEQMTTEPQRRISDISMFTLEERERVLTEWNATKVPYPRKCLHELFEEQARRTPHAIAVEHKEQRLCYAELNARANQMAHYLRDQGVAPEVRVGICVKRGLGMIVGLLGILKAGGAYVPMDPAYPRERLQYILEDAQVEVLLSELGSADHFSGGRARVICLEAELARIGEGSTSDPQWTKNPENLAYVIYTSGSTGRPKGVAIEHRSASVLVHWAGKLFGATELDAVLASTSICFDLSVFEIFVPLSWGGTVLLVNSALDLAEMAGAERVKLINTVPSVMAELLRMRAVPTSVRTVNLAGEVLHRSLVDQIYEGLNIERLFNLYGPSEDTTYSTYACLEPATRGPVSIGRPIANTQVFVLDKSLHPVPVGVLGELYIGGSGLARGYLNQPSLTAELFVPNPFSREKGERLYRTGDQVRWQEEGTLEFFGRIDHQVKVRGFRIELGEIETILREHAGVQEAAAVVWEATPGNLRLAAYVVRNGKHDCSANELQEYLKERLPEHMIPSTFVMLEFLPRTLNGKLDRKALPRPETQYRAQEYVPLLGPVEEILGGIWMEVLGHACVGAVDNFFELGGHSLLATRVISRVRQVFAVNLPVRAIFDAPTLRALAGRLREATPWTSASPVPQQVSRVRELPLSYSQEQMWFMDQLHPGSAAYNMAFALKLKGELNRDALCESLNDIITRHEVLRTNFLQGKNGPLQKIHPVLRLQIEEISLRETEEQERAEMARRVIQAEFAMPFDLACGAQLRAKLVDLAPQECLLLLTMHHIVSDGWSMSVMASEFARFYRGRVLGDQASLKPPEIQYADYAAWQREWLQGSELEKHLAYWTKQIQGVPVLELPTDVSRAHRSGHPANAGRQLPCELDTELTYKLTSLSRREGVSLFMTLLAAFNVLAFRYTGLDDVAVGTPVACRRWPATERMIGPFVNTLVLRTRIEPQLTFRELLQRVRQITLEAYEHQDLPFEKLVEVLHPHRDFARNPLFRVMLVLQNMEADELELPQLRVEMVIPESSIEKFDMTLRFHESRDEGLKGVLSYATDLFGEVQARRMLEHFRVVLGAMVADPSRQLGYFSLLTETERQQTLTEWNQASVRMPSRLIHEALEAQARRTPSAPAVEFAGKSVSYEQINRRANQLARYLQSLGVGREVKVGLCLERGIDMIVGLFGILKAGGAYVPMDIGYPTGRFLHILEDAHASLVLTQDSASTNFSSYRGGKVCLDTAWPDISKQNCTNLESSAFPENIAYVLYTSGSTGAPKGVCVEHRQVMNYVDSVMLRMNLRGACSFAMVQPLLVDACLTALFPPLFAGGCVYLVSSECSLDPGCMGTLLSRTEVAGLKIAPSHLAALQAASPRSRIMPDRVLILGGEPCRWSWLKDVGDSAPGCAIFNQYGPTETTVAVLVYQLETGSKPGAFATCPLGRPLANTQIYILDQQAEPVPIGVMGEIYIGGANVSRGYLNEPALTAERFLPDPFHGEGGQRLYRTGDRARYLDDGNVEFCGRLDDQLKLRGFRIEPAEIETLLTLDSGISEACVMVRGTTVEDQRLIAYVVLNAGRSLAEEQLKAHLKKHLPDYMVPAEFVVLPELPRAAHGKLDRKSLPERDRSIGPSEYEAPQDEEEKRLCEIWAEALQLKSIGRGDNFFSLGGHSLLGVQVVAQIREVFQVNLALRTLFEFPTVMGLAERIRVDRAAKGAHELPAGLQEVADNLYVEQVLDDLESLSEEEVQQMLATRVNH